MQAATNSFKDEITRIRKCLALIDSMVAFGSIRTTEQLSPIAVRLSQEIKEAGALVVQTSYDGALLNLAAAFEGFVSEMLEEFLGLLPLRVADYRLLKRELQVSNERLTGEALFRQNQPRYKLLDTRKLVRNLHLSNEGGQPYSLNAEAISILDRNFGPTEIAEFLGRLEISDLWRKVGQDTGIQNYFGFTDPRATEKAARERLDEFTSSRNSVAHGAKPKPSVGSSVILDYAKYLEILADSLVSVCESHLDDLSLPKGPP